MNFNLPLLPKRSGKPRKQGITMVMDKGLSLKEAESFAGSCSELVDFVKFGFGTSLVTKDLRKKIKVYKEAKIQPYFGGTLFEAFIVRDLFKEYIRFAGENELEVVEVSDGSIRISHAEKCRYISELSNKFRVISEVGAKDAAITFSPGEWIKMIKAELKAGSFKVIAEARESGNVGIYNSDGSAQTDLIHQILSHIKQENIIWEAPNKSQQVWFVKLLGSEVNLGNIAPSEVIPLETIRLGLRGDTFLHFLPENIKAQYR